VNVDCIAHACEVAVIRALDTAAKRARDRSGRRDANRFRRLNDSGVPWHEMYQHDRFPEDQYDRILKDAWVSLGAVFPDCPHLAVACDEYCRYLFRTQARHNPARLREYVETACEHVAAG
jgi:hypothetical protein